MGVLALRGGGRSGVTKSGMATKHAFGSLLHAGGRLLALHSCRAPALLD